MKRRALLGHLKEHRCVPVREGGSHSIWSNPQSGRKEAVLLSWNDEGGLVVNAFVKRGEFHPVFGSEAR